MILQDLLFTCQCLHLMMKKLCLDHSSPSFCSISLLYLSRKGIHLIFFIFGFRKKDKARMRLVAAKGLIKLVQNTNYTDVMTVDQFLQLSLSIQVNGLCTFCN